MTAYLAYANKVLPAWALYWLTIIDFGEHTNPGAVPSFSEGYQSILPIPAPPIPEQRAIISFLDEKAADIDALRKKVITVVDHLREYRTTLITNAVTGKINVQGYRSEEKAA